MRTASLLLTLILTGSAATACEVQSEPLRSYVALGDSYTAAPGLPPPGGTDICFRSENNYPHQVAREADLELKDVSCSAATSLAATATQTTTYGAHIPPQLDAIDRETDLVTIGLGANDFGLVSRIFLHCVQSAATSSSAMPCTDTDATGGDRSIANRLDDVQRNVEAVLDAVRQKSPSARILLIGYPEIFPEDDVCPALPVATGDLPLARGLVDGLNAAVEAAARNHGADFVDVFAATRGHHICSDDPWIAGATTVEGRGATPWHPYAEEQDAVADLILNKIS